MRRVEREDFLLRVKTTGSPDKGRSQRIVNARTGDFVGYAVVADLLPVQADDATIERAADVLSDHDDGDDRDEDTCLCGERRSPEEDADLHRARTLAAAGLLAGVRTGRSEAEVIAEVRELVEPLKGQWQAKWMTPDTFDRGVGALAQDVLAIIDRAAQGTDTEGSEDRD